MPGKASVAVVVTIVLDPGLASLYVPYTSSPLSAEYLVVAACTIEAIAAAQIAAIAARIIFVFMPVSFLVFVEDWVCETLAVVRLLSCAENSKRTTTRRARRRFQCRSMPPNWRHLRFTVQRRWSPKEDGRYDSTSFYDLSILPRGVFCGKGQYGTEEFGRRNGGASRPGTQLDLISQYRKPKSHSGILLPKPISTSSFTT